MVRLPPVDPALPPVWMPYGRKSHPAEKLDQRLTEREQRRGTLEYCQRRIREAGRGQIADPPWAYDDKTGLSAERPHYQARLERTRELRRAGHPVIWVVRQFDRLGRDGEELHRVNKELAALGAEFHDVSFGGQIPATVLPMLIGQAASGSVSIGANVKRTNASVRRDGWWRPGRRPWGYEIVPATPEQEAAGSPKVVLAEHPAEAEKCAEAWQRAKNGESPRRISRWVATLTSEQRGGRVLNHWNLTLMLRSRLWCGQQPDGAPGKWPALVSLPDWRTVQEKLDGAKTGLAKQASGNYLLTGRLYCPVEGCGCRMRGGVSAQREGHSIRRRYRCSSELAGSHYPRACNYAVMCEPVDADVLRQVEPLVGAGLRRYRREIEAEVRALLAERAPKTDVQARLQAAEAKIANADRRAVVLGQKLADELLTDDEYRVQIADSRLLRAEGQAELRAALNDDVEQINMFLKPRPTTGSVMAKLDEWQRHWQHADVPERRDVLVELVARVVPERDAGGKVHAQITWTEEGQLLADVVSLVAGDAQQPVGEAPDESAPR